MKYQFKKLTIAVIFMFIPVWLSAQNCINLEGAWIMIHAEYSSDDTSFVYTDIDFEPVKILTDNYFAFGYIQELESEDSMLAGGGVYEYDNYTYSETIRYHTATGNIGDTITFDCRMEDNRWYHEGVLPTSPFGNNFQIREIWQRLDNM